MSDDETKFPDSTDSSGSTDEFIQNLEDELDDDSSDNSSSDEEAESQDSRIKRLKSDSTSETEASTSSGTAEQKLVSSVNVDGCTHPGSFGGICIHCGKKVDGESGVSFGYIHKMSDGETEFPDGTDSSASTDELIQNNLDDELDDDGSDNSSSDEEAESQDSRIKRLKSDSTSETKASTSAGTAEQKLDGCMMHPGSFGGICIHCGQKVDGESGVLFGYIHKVSEHPKKMKTLGGKAKDGEKPQRLTNRKRISSIYRIFIISAIFFLCCDGSEAYYYDYFKLVEQWAPGVCIHNGNCHTHVNKESFTIHGLWVENSTKPSSKPKPDGLAPSCPKLSKKMSLRMRREWPSLYQKSSEELWQHEWEQHGYFSDMTCDEYRIKVLFFHQNCDVKKALEESGILPSNNPIDTKIFMNQLASKIGKPELMCHKGDLIEVRCCFERNGMRTNCPQTIHCRKNLKYLPVPAPAPPPPVDPRTCPAPAPHRVSTNSL